MRAGYEEALPGAADRILKTAEAQQAHRLSIEDKVIDGNIVSERIGTVVGGYGGKDSIGTDNGRKA